MLKSRYRFFLLLLIFNAIFFVVSERVFSSDVLDNEYFINKERVLDSEVKALSLSLSHYIMAGIYDSQNKIPLAISEYEEVLKYNENIAYIYVRLASDFFLKGINEQAEKMTLKATSLEPENVKVKFLTAMIAAAKNDYIKAEMLYKEIIVSEPENLHALSILADLLLVEGKIDEALEIYEKMSGILKNSFVINFNLGVLYTKMEKWDRAEQILEKVLMLDKNHIEANFLLGFIYESKGELDKAVNQYNGIIEKDKFSRDAYYRIYDIFLREKAFKKAEDTLRLFIQLVPSEEEAYVKLFSMYLVNDDYKNAEKILKEALNNNVESADIYSNLGYLALLASDYISAVRYYKKSVEINPEDLGNKFYLSVALNKSGNKKDAICVLEKSVSSGKVIAEIYNYLGFLYVESGENLEEAVYLIKEALKLDPSNIFYMNSLGSAFDKKRDLDTALNYFLIANSANTGDAEILENLVDIYISKKDFWDTKEFWEKAYKLEPDNNALSEKFKNIQEQGSL
ncbi:conserved hypothetical protein, secreted [Candidatus Omnitrophus magneticus]|uniref:Uncharacterized protein n=1 Tax=Candidatus Omnitrophus magneticus TaxID=1609969 RepID=A0A0F0CRV9_9BACT|nr:conserved hypothetical protein, secreted [Candidatus Omnitrophus magneticus]